ncbi:unnamed protein product [Laminaria digitata]
MGQSMVSHGTSHGFHGACHGVPWDMPWFPMGHAMVSHGTSHGFPWDMPWFTIGNPIVSHGTCHGFPCEIPSFLMGYIPWDVGNPINVEPPPRHGAPLVRVRSVVRQSSRRWVCWNYGDALLGVSRARDTLRGVS